MYNLGIPGDVDNSIFMINAYPWSDTFGVIPSDDFSRRMNGGAAQTLPAQRPVPQTQTAQTPHWIVWAVIVFAVIAIIAMTR